MEDTNTFSLPNETLIIKFIPRKVGMSANVEDNHVISGGMLINSVRRFSAPIARNGAVQNVLTKEEKDYLEGATGLNLSVYGDYWKDHFVPLYKDDTANILNLNEPKDYISYKILLSLRDDICPNWEDRNKNQTYQFAITKEGEELAENKRKYDTKKEAFKLYGKIEDDREKLAGVLKLLTNRPISSDSSLIWLQSKVEENIDTNPSAFVNVVKDKNFYVKMLINEAIEKKIILKKNNKYSTADGLDLCDAGELPTLDNVIRYLDNPKNQDVRDVIEAKVNKS